MATKRQIVDIEGVFGRAPDCCTEVPSLGTK